MKHAQDNATCQCWNGNVSLFTFVASERISAGFALLKCIIFYLAWFWPIYFHVCHDVFRRCQFAAGRHNELRQIENRINSHSCMAKWPCSFILSVCIFTSHFITVFLSHDLDSNNITSDRMDGMGLANANLIYLFVTSKRVSSFFSPCCLTLDYGSLMAEMKKKNNYFRQSFISIH